jgi:uncharacterized protein (DUF305 family)
MKTLVVAVTMALGMSGMAAAQGMPAADLPDVCLKQVTMNHGAMGGGMAGGMGGGMGMQGGDEAHLDLMDGMGQMNADMMAGGTAEDIDVAFVCSMIPHHRGAIDMAKAELAHGDDAWAKEMAQKVIDAQEKEIADMLAWLEKQPG